MLAPVFFEDEFHHVVFQVVREINIYVREFVQRHAFLVQKAPEIKVETNWTNAADAEAIADKTVRRASARDPFDATPPALLQKIPGDEEVFLVAHFVDDTEFLHYLRVKLVGSHSVTLAQTLQNESPEEFAWR